MRLARNLSSSAAGSAIRLLLVGSLLLSFMVFAAAAPEAAYAAPTVTRTQSAGPVTIGETIDCTVTVTIEPHRNLLSPRIRDQFSNRAMYYVPGSARLVDIDRPAGSDSVAFTDTTGNPVVVYNTGEGLRLRWPLNDFSNTTDEPYTFALEYQLQVTGVGPNDFVLWFPAGANQGFDGTTTFLWTPASDPAVTNDVISNTTRTDVDQPLLTLEKYPHILGTDVPDVPVGAIVPFNIRITNTGWSDAHDISILDDVVSGADFLPDPELVSVKHSTAGDITEYVGFATVGEDYRLDLSSYPLEPGGVIEVEMLATLDPALTAPDTADNWADVDWSTMPGDVVGERVYEDQDWEGTDWTQDTDTATLDVVDGPFIKVDKRVREDSPYAVAVGRETTFEITLTNTGSQTAPAVGLSDLYDKTRLSFMGATIDPDDSTDDGWLDWPDVTGGDGLAPGASMSISLTFQATDVTGKTTNTSNSWNPGGAQGTSIDEAMIDAAWYPSEPDWPFGSTDSAEVLIYDPADITFTKDANPGTSTILLPGDVITYHVYGENATGFNLPAVLAFDTLPDSVEYIPGTLRASVPIYGEFTFTDAMFDGGGVDLDDEGWYDPTTRTAFFLSAWGAPQGMLADLYFQVRVRELTYSAAGVLNTAHLLIDPASLNEEPQVTSNSVYHFVDPITITKTATDVNGGKLVPGDEILWTMVIQNIGLSQTTNVVVNDTVPAATTYVPGSITGPGATDVAAPALRWNVGVLAVNQSATLTFRSKVNAGIPAGTTISNQATVDSDQSNVRASDFPSTTVRGDATLLRTGGDEIILLVIGMLVALAGVVLVRRGRGLLARG